MFMFTVIIAHFFLLGLRAECRYFSRCLSALLLYGNTSYLNTCLQAWLALRLQLIGATLQALLLASVTLPLYFWPSRLEQVSPFPLGFNFFACSRLLSFSSSASGHVSLSLRECLISPPSVFILLLASLRASLCVACASPEANAGSQWQLCGLSSSLKSITHYGFLLILHLIWHYMRLCIYNR